MRPFLSAEEQAFRAEVQAFLAAHADVRSFFAHEGQADVDQRRLYRALGERNWLAIAWPPEAGGLGKPPVYEFILWDEMAYARAARPPIGSGIVAKTIIAHGTDEQKERFLPGLRRGDLFFSLGYSEPEAGSDLGGLRTRAVRDGDRYVRHRREALDVGGPPRRLPVAAVPYRHAREPGTRADAADRRPALAGDHDLADPGHRRRAVQRGPPRRRRGAGRQPGRRGERGVDS